MTSSEDLSNQQSADQLDASLPQGAEPPNLRLGAILAAAFAVVAIAVGTQHRALLTGVLSTAAGVEWDFHYVYARDALRLLDLRVPVDVYRGPLYPATLALLKLALPFWNLFDVAKAVSVASGAVAVFASFLIASRLLGRTWGALATVALATTPPFFTSAVLVGTDMFFAALTLWAVYFLMRALDGGARAPIWAGLLTGLALDTRWNAFFLAACGVACLALFPASRERTRRTLLFAAAALAVAVPWWAFNAWHYGSPFFNRNYENVGLAIYGEGQYFTSTAEVILRDPVFFFTKWVSNTASRALGIALQAGFLVVLAIPGLAVILKRGRRETALWALPLCALLLTTVNALGPDVLRQGLPALLLVTTAICACLRWIEERAPGGFRERRAAAVAVWAVVCLFNGGRTVSELRENLGTEALLASSFAFSARQPNAPIAGDWDRDGRDFVGIARDGRISKVFYLFDAPGTGPADTIASFGAPGWSALGGDWNGDGRATLGARFGQSFFLSDSAFAKPADVIAQFGDAASLPLVGDWDGDARDSVGIFANGAFALSDRLAPPFEARGVVLGEAGDLPVAGDWDGDGVDTVGVYRDGVFHLTNERATTPSDVLVIRADAPPGVPLAGDWDGDGVDTPAVYADGTFYLLDRNGNRVGEWTVPFGSLCDLPITGE